MNSICGRAPARSSARARSAMNMKLPLRMPTSASSGPPTLRRISRASSSTRCAICSAPNNKVTLVMAPHVPTIVMLGSPDFPWIAAAPATRQASRAAAGVPLNRAEPCDLRVAIALVRAQDHGVAPGGLVDRIRKALGLEAAAAVLDVVAPLAAAAMQGVAGVELYARLVGRDLEHAAGGGMHHSGDRAQRARIAVDHEVGIEAV